MAILPAGYVGQQSFVSLPEVLHVFRPDVYTLGRLLDAGCGTAALSIEICRRQPLAYLQGFDNWSLALRNAARCARALGMDERASFQVADLDDCESWPADYFDSILSLDALQHVIDLHSALEGIFSRWTRRGPVLITLWCFESKGYDLCTRWGFSRGWTRGDVAEIVHEVCPSLEFYLSRAFERRLRESVGSLQRTRGYFESQWGSEAYEQRLSLESKTLAAVQRRHLSQVCLRWASR